nr:uncharacterized protein LOC116156268 [Camelus dromedarius]
MCAAAGRVAAPERSRRPGKGRGGEGRDRHRGGTPACRPASPALEETEPRNWAPALPAASAGIAAGLQSPTPPGSPTLPHGGHNPETGAADVGLTSEVTPRRGGSRDSAGGRFRSTRRAGAADVGLRDAARGRESALSRELLPAWPRGVPPHSRGWRASPEAPARPAIPRWSALASCLKFAFYPPPRPCLLSQWRCGSKDMEEKERCDRFRSVLLL